MWPNIKLIQERHQKLYIAKEKGLGIILVYLCAQCGTGRRARNENESGASTFGIKTLDRKTWIRQ